MNEKAKVEDFGARFEPLPIAESYYPTRLEYFAGKVLQGIIVGRADKVVGNTEKIAKACVALAQALEKEVDSTQN